MKTYDPEKRIQAAKGIMAEVVIWCAWMITIPIVALLMLVIIVLIMVAYHAVFC